MVEHKEGSLTQHCNIAMLDVYCVLCNCIVQCAMCSVYCLCAVCCAVMEGHKGDTLGRPRISHSHEYTIATSHLPSTQMHLTHFFLLKISLSLHTFILGNHLKFSLKMVTINHDKTGQGLRKYQIFSQILLLHLTGNTHCVTHSSSIAPLIL